jgi:hypothetical protein
MNKIQNRRNNLSSNHGGVPVAAEVAKRLNAPLDVSVVTQAWFAQPIKSQPRWCRNIFTRSASSTKIFPRQLTRKSASLLRRLLAARWYTHDTGYFYRAADAR